MALADDVVREAAAQLCRQEVTIGQQFTKPQIAAALVAIDAFLTTNSAAIVAAFPEPFRSGSTVPQKAALLAFVCLRRYAPAGQIGQAP